MLLRCKIVTGAAWKSRREIHPFFFVFFLVVFIHLAVFLGEGAFCKRHLGGRHLAQQKGADGFCCLFFVSYLGYYSDHIIANRFFRCLLSSCGYKFMSAALLFEEHTFL